MSKKPKPNSESRTRVTRTTPTKPKGVTREPKPAKQPKRGELPVGKYATPIAPQVPLSTFTHKLVQDKHPRNGQLCYVIDSLPQDEKRVTVRFRDGGNQVVSRAELHEVVQGKDGAT